jgi:mono/diheme cytochrome c family protein
MRKLLGAVLIGLMVWVASTLVGFPRVFRWFFLGYVFFGFLFFLLLDASPGRMPKHPIRTVFVFFLLSATILTATGFFLPQFNPETEIEKIQRFQQAALERERAKQLQVLRALVPEEHKETSVVQVTPVEAATPAIDEKLITRGKQVYQDYECYNCHKIGGQGGVKRRGPDLDNVGNVLSPELLKQKIFDPEAFYAEGFEREFTRGVMPDTFRDLMSEEEVNALVAYLSSLQNTSVETPRGLFPDGKPVPLPQPASAKEEEPVVAALPPCKDVPPDYANKHMPDGWWVDEEVITAGKAIYEGKTKPDVICAACHGWDGKPLLTGAKDLRDPAIVDRLTDCLWFFKVSEGVPQTPMTAWKEKLTEKEIWQVIAYEHTFSHSGKPAVHTHPE